MAAHETISRGPIVSVVYDQFDRNLSVQAPCPELERASRPQRSTPEAEVERKSLYTIDELAKLHALSRYTVMRLYEREPGVQILERPEVVRGRGGPKRRYRSLRVPHEVYERVRRRLTLRGNIQ